MPCHIAKAKALERAGGHCEDCGEALKQGAFHVHHKTYERKNKEWPEDLEVLCLPCHNKRHPHHEFIPTQEQQNRARSGTDGHKTREPRPDGSPVMGWKDGQWPVQCARCRRLLVDRKGLEQHTTAVHPDKDALSVRELEGD